MRKSFGYHSLVYTGKVLRYDPDSVIRTKNPQHTQAAARKRRGRGKAKAALPPAYVETHCPSVFVQWYDAGEAASSVFLVAGKYNRPKVVDGWVVVEEDTDKGLYDEDSRTTLEKLKQEAMEAAFLYDINM